MADEEITWGKRGGARDSAPAAQVHLGPGLALGAGRAVAPPPDRHGEVDAPLRGKNPHTPALQTNLAQGGVLAPELASNEVPLTSHIARKQWQAAPRRESQRGAATRQPAPGSPPPPTHPPASSTPRASHSFPSAPCLDAESAKARARQGHWETSAQAAQAGHASGRGPTAGTAREHAAGDDVGRVKASRGEGRGSRARPRLRCPCDRARPARAALGRGGDVGRSVGAAPAPDAGRRRRPSPAPAPPRADMGPGAQARFVHSAK